MEIDLNLDLSCPWKYYMRMGASVLNPRPLISLATTEARDPKAIEYDFITYFPERFFAREYGFWKGWALWILFQFKTFIFGSIGMYELKFKRYIY